MLVNHKEIAAALQVRIDYLEDCMRYAGLTAFLRDKNPEDIAEHLYNVMQSYTTYIEKLEEKVVKLIATEVTQGGYIAKLEDELTALKIEKG